MRTNLAKLTFRYKKILGGGSLLDVGAYPIKISQLFLGPEIYIKSASLETPIDKEVDIWGSALIKQINGNLTSQVAFGFDHFYQNNLELWGSEGKISTSRIFTAGPEFAPIINVETNNTNDSFKLPPDNHFFNMLTYFYQQIILKKDIENEYQQNINQARLIHELREKSHE